MTHSWPAIGLYMLLNVMILQTAGNVDVVVPLNEWYTTRGSSAPGSGVGIENVIQWGIQDAWENDFQNQTIDVNLQLEILDSQGTAAISVKNLIESSLRGLTLSIGYSSSENAVYSAEAGTSYGVAQLSAIVSSARLSDKSEFPYFSRLSPTAVEYATTFIDILLHMIDTQSLGWGKIALLTTSDQYGISTAQAVIAQAKSTPIEVAVWESILPGSKNVSVEVREVAHSDARVIIMFCSSGYNDIFREAEKEGLIDGNHVFMGGPIFTGPSPLFLPDGGIDFEMLELMRGQLGLSVRMNEQGERYERFMQRYTTDDPMGAAGFPPSIFQELYFDLGVLTAQTVVEARRQGLLDYDRYPSAMDWTRIARGIEFDGASGPVKLNENGDRPIPMTVSNWRPEVFTWQPVGVWTPEVGVEFFADQPIVWPDNTTNYPDLLLGPGYHYWSCSAGEKLFDDTGHSVKLHTPDSGGFDDIDASYICDNFIDCPNMSDESGDCSSNYKALYIAFGIITGLLIVMTCCLIPFVIVFGFIIPRRRVRASSPTFLLIIILSCLLGYISEYSWYGRPHPVACGFRPWLLGLAVVSLVSALNAKTWRLWRIFKKAYKKERISDIQLIVLYVIMVIPAILILVIWTIVSTPTAGLKVQNDDREHYVCKTGGFTGEPGGLVFFFILVGYEALVLLVAAILCIATRNVPSFFNESKLIAISIYNLGFLAAVCIPVIIVLEYINPFAAWVIRSVAVLYAFTATLVLQFASKVIGVIVIDRGRDAALPSLGKVSTVRSSSSSEQTLPSASQG